MDVNNREENPINQHPHRANWLQPNRIAQREQNRMEKVDEVAPIVNEGAKTVGTMFAAAQENPVVGLFAPAIGAVAGEVGESASRVAAAVAIPLAAKMEEGSGKSSDMSGESSNKC